MKRRDLMKTLKAMAKEAGETLGTEEGAKHTKVWFGGRQTTVPRHTEVNEITAKKIIEQMGGK